MFLILDEIVCSAILNYMFIRALISPRIAGTGFSHSLLELNCIQ